MKSILGAIVFSLLTVGVAQANVYHCKFRTGNARGFTPPEIYLVRDKGIVFFGRDQLKTSGADNAVRWTARLLTNSGHRRVKYSLAITDGIQGGSVPARLTIDVTGRQRGNAQGQCELAKQ